MEFLDQIGDFLNKLTEQIDRFLRRLFGSSNERFVKEAGFVRTKDGTDSVIPGSALDRINQLEPDYEKLTEGELKETATRLRSKLADGKTLDDILPEAFAAARESSKRYLKLRHYDVQMVGGYTLNKGMIAEMKTGEGKTLVATLPSFLNGLAGSVHVVTVNDYLARRDMEWMGPIHLGLGLKVGAIQNNSTTEEKHEAYNADITYGTNNEFGFDYLRDNMKPSRDLQVQRGLDYAIVDEIDNILIDEARTPLIIAGPADDDLTKYPKAHKVARQLIRDEDFEVKEKEHTCHLTDTGIRKAENLVGVDSFYTQGNMEWPHYIDNALRAIHLFKKDVEYVVEKGEIVIVDENTGRKMYGRQWSDGLHQAVEAKEGVKIKESTQTLATVTLQNYFRIYNKLSGMTGTALTEANEFYKIYKLDVVAIPTNRPNQRKDQPDYIFRTLGEKYDAIVDEIRTVHKTGQPILVGTVSVEKSEIVSKKLDRYGIKHNVLNAKNHEREAEIVSQAGRLGAVTISTNMAGRGTDIILGGNPEYMAWDELGKKYSSRLDVPKSEWDEVNERIATKENMHEMGAQVRQHGGLYVIGTERHDARRIDLQLRGRSGRQGDPGKSRFFISLEDDLMRIFAGDTVKSFLSMAGMKDGEAIESPMVTRQVEGAQKKREEFHFDQRKNLLEYDEVMDQQRKNVYGYRQEILDGKNCRQLILDMIDEQIADAIENFLRSDYRYQTISAAINNTYGIEVGHTELVGRPKDDLIVFIKEQANRQAEDIITEQIDENLSRDDTEENWNWASLSRWANLRYGMNTNERELKKMERSEVSRYLTEKAHQAITKYDFSGLDEFLKDNYERLSLCSFINERYGYNITLEEINQEEPHQVEEYIVQKLHKEYREQEVRFPVTVGFSRFMSSNSASEGFDRAGMISWALKRFGQSESSNGIAQKSAEDIKSWMLDLSTGFLAKGDAIEELPSLMQKYAPPPVKGKKRDDSEEPVDDSWIEPLESWAKINLGIEPELAELDEKTPEKVQGKILSVYDQTYRPEFSHTERQLVLSILDSAWKDHLYYMDYLRSGIGLMGYAQKDPKVEYKREGMKAFEGMWNTIGFRVTGMIYRIENEQKEYMGNLWNITTTRHDDPDDYVENANQGNNGNQQSQQSDPEPVKPIRNIEKKVGRNDPCPCGSGKKYKKCHGAVE